MPIAGIERIRMSFTNGNYWLHSAKIQGMTSVSVSINAGKTNVIMGTMMHNLWGGAPLRIRSTYSPSVPVLGLCLNFAAYRLFFK